MAPENEKITAKRQGMKFTFAGFGDFKYFYHFVVVFSPG